MSEPYVSAAYPAAGTLDAARAASRRGAFVTRTYQHLLGAVMAFTAIEVLLFTSGLAYPIAAAMLSVNWLMILGAFMVCGWLFSGMAQKATTPLAQYGALGGYVLAQAVIFVPLLVLAEYGAPGAISSAAVATLIGFTGLTAVAIISGKDFSFLGSLLKWGGVVAVLMIVCGVIFGFALGTFFSVAMVALAGGAILYETSKIVHHYPEDRHVAASLALFSSVALLFWYVLRIFMSRD
jgi:uncharacterized protein